MTSALVVPFYGTMDTGCGEWHSKVYLGWKQTSHVFSGYSPSNSTFFSIAASSNRPAISKIEVLHVTVCPNVFYVNKNTYSITPPFYLPADSISPAQPTRIIDVNCNLVSIKKAWEACADFSMAVNDNLD